jgi:hypothetical protein
MCFGVGILSRSCVLLLLASTDFVCVDPEWCEQIKNEFKLGDRKVHPDLLSRRESKGELPKVSVGVHHFLPHFHTFHTPKQRIFFTASFSTWFRRHDSACLLYDATSMCSLWTFPLARYILFFFKYHPFTQILDACIPQKGNCPPEFLVQWRNANRSLNPFSSATGLKPKAKKAKKAAAA